MNGTSASLVEVESLIANHLSEDCEVLLCPPATLMARMADMTKGRGLLIGGQDCHAKTSAPMLAAAGASHVILGHSERRTDHQETDASVCAKAEAAHADGLVTLICIGETEAERDASREIEVIGTQLGGSVPDGSTGGDTVIAYEPVWANGSGRTPTSIRSHRCITSCVNSSTSASARKLKRSACFTAVR